MKNLLFITAFLITFCFSCKKDNLSLWDESEIVSTDNNGTIISNGSPNDWTEQDFNSDANFYDMQQSICRLFYNILNGYDTNGCVFNENCTENTNFSVVFYPNPVPSGQSPRVKITSSKKIVLVGLGDKTKGVDGLTSDAIIALPIPDYEADIEVVDFDFRNGNDIELYITIMTEDSCINYTKGKVKYL